MTEVYQDESGRLRLVGNLYYAGPADNGGNIGGLEACVLPYV